MHPVILMLVGVPIACSGLVALVLLARELADAWRWWVRYCEVARLERAWRLPSRAERNGIARPR